MEQADIITSAKAHLLVGLIGATMLEGLAARGPFMAELLGTGVILLTENESATPAQRVEGQRIILAACRDHPSPQATAVACAMADMSSDEQIRKEAMDLAGRMVAETDAPMGLTRMGLATPVAARWTEPADGEGTTLGIQFDGPAGRHGIVAILRVRDGREYLADCEVVADLSSAAQEMAETRDEPLTLEEWGEVDTTRAMTRLCTALTEAERICADNPELIDAEPTLFGDSSFGFWPALRSRMRHAGIPATDVATEHSAGPDGGGHTEVSDRGGGGESPARVAADGTAPSNRGAASEGEPGGPDPAATPIEDALALVIATVVSQGTPPVGGPTAKDAESAESGTDGPGPVRRTGSRPHRTRAGSTPGGHLRLVGGSGDVDGRSHASEVPSRAAATGRHRPQRDLAQARRTRPRRRMHRPSDGSAKPAWMEVNQNLRWVWLGAAPAPRGSTCTICVRADVIGTKPPVWRRLLVPGQATFDDFSRILLVAFDWPNPGGYVLRIQRPEQVVAFGNRSLEPFVNEGSRFELQSFTKHKPFRMDLFPVHGPQDLGTPARRLWIRVEKIRPEVTVLARCLTGALAAPGSSQETFDGITAAAIDRNLATMHLGVRPTR